MNVPIYDVRLCVIIQIPLNQEGHDLWIHMLEVLFFNLGHAILFACTTTSISPNWTLEFFYLNSTLSSCLLVATLLLFSIVSSTVNLNLYVVDHIRENL